MDINQKTCGYIGFTPSYNWVQVSYLQSEWFINYIIGNIKLPDNNILQESINIELEKKKKLNLNYNDLTYNCFEYCDNLNNQLNKKVINLIYLIGFLILIIKFSISIKLNKIIL